MSKFFERCTRIKNVNAEITPLTLKSLKWDTLYRNEAVQCFCMHFPIASIVVASALIETCLRWEHSRRNPNVTSNNFERDNLIYLFKSFLNSTVPLDKLLDADENIESLRNDGKKFALVKYILTRNYFAHGAILHPVKKRSPLVPVDEYRFDPGDLFYPITYLSFLLPYNKQELIAYGINSSEPILETVAYVHLFKTLRFITAFNDAVIQQKL